jgi:hypothetical protein
MLPLPVCEIASWDRFRSLATGNGAFVRAPRLKISFLLIPWSQGTIDASKLQGTLHCDVRGYLHGSSQRFRTRASETFAAEFEGAKIDRELQIQR